MQIINLLPFDTIDVSTYLHPRTFPNQTDISLAASDKGGTTCFLRDITPGSVTIRALVSTLNASPTRLLGSPEKIKMEASSMILVIIIKTVIWGDPVAGYPSTVCILFLVSGVQMFTIGILGQYISKSYMETKHRPHYIIRETNNNTVKGQQ